MEITIGFDKSTLLIGNLPDHILSLLNQVKWDSRTGEHRAPAYYYRDIVLTLRHHKIAYKDLARKFQPHKFPIKAKINPRPYQKEALNAWQKQGSKGVVVLPTGAGKTILAVLCIEQTSRPTLIHVPTIDLMHQWHDVLKKHFDIPIGLLGGGANDIQPITVATYDSALLHVPHKGNQFGFQVFDECHHLPGAQFQYTAIGSIAPFRLGLTATPERNDGKENLLYQLCGALCFQSHIHELKGSTLSPYDVVTIEVEMQAEEREKYEIARQCYIDFLHDEQIFLNQPNGWNIFLYKTYQSQKGREAFKSYLLQKQLSQASKAKEEEIWQIVQQHTKDRILIFTQDNDMAYRIGKRFFWPVLTHNTKIKERTNFLDQFRKGSYSILVTSKVLNEGVDVPEANVGIIVSGSGSIREHVQRLGRLLRAREDKHALLYELVSKNTSEYFVNKRRRKHSAYQKSSTIQNT
ncbi:type III restriction protein res subunit [Candidatus Magnetomorum sp. HK-1]|nr:type III restriction protein res subunit [Candidatus Magnetomorum sp. HK-1]